MRLQLAWTLALAALAPAAARAEDTSWIFTPARYTHSPRTGQRVTQYSPEAPACLRYDDTYQESGYRHNTVSLCVGDNGDHLHVVQTWGQGLLIRPYGEWEYPYRPGATPYGPWGNSGSWNNSQAPWGTWQGPSSMPYPSWQNPYALGQGPQGPGSGWPNQQPQFGGPWGGGQGGGGPWGGGPSGGTSPPPPPPSP